MTRPRIPIARIFAVMMLFCILLPICSCSNDPFGTMVPQSVSIRQVSPSSPDIRNASVRLSDVQYEVFTLEAEALLKDGSTSRDIAWTVPDKGITVHDSSNGALTFSITDVGTFVLTATARYNGQPTGTSASVTVSVLGALTSLGVRKEGTTAITDSISVSTNDEEPTRLIPVFTPEDSTQKDVSWEFSSNDFFTLTEEEYVVTDTPNRGETLNTALIRPLAAGTGKVTLRSENNPQIYKEITVIVRTSATEQETPATAVTFTESNITIPIGSAGQKTLRTTVSDGYGNIISTGAVEFESEDTSVVEIISYNERQCTIQGMGPGSTLITATYVTDEGKELVATVKVTTSGAVERISTDSTYYSFLVGTTTGEDDIKVLYSPDDTVQKGYSVTVSNPSAIGVISPAMDDYVVLKLLSEGETDVTLTSVADPSVTYTFTVNAVRELTAGDRINKLTIDKPSVTFRPPFTSASETLSVSTIVYVDDSRQNTAVGSYDTYKLKWESSDPGVVSVADNLDGTARIIPHKPGEATITATSVVGGDELRYSVSSYVTVEGGVESLIPARNSIQVITGGSEQLSVSPYPASAIVTDDSSAGSGYVTFTLDDNVTASALMTINRNTGEMVFTIKGLQPGTTTLHVLVDGTELLKIPVTVTARDDKYMTKLVFDSSSAIMAQDSDPVTYTLTGYDQNDEEMALSYENVVYTLIEDGKTTTDLSSSRHVRISTSGNGVFMLSPKEPGVATLRASAVGNGAGVSTALRIEVGGSEIHDGLINIRPGVDKVQIRQGRYEDIPVRFIPYSYEDGNDLSMEWEIDEGDDGLNAKASSLSDNKVRIDTNGLAKGIDIITGRHAASQSSTSFTVEVVDSSEDAYKVELDKYYLSFDRNQKEPPAVTATVLRNGVAASGVEVEWKFMDADNQFITKKDSGNTTIVSMSSHEDETGWTYLTAEVRIDGEVKASASCYVEVVDSSAAAELRAITTEYESLIINKADGVAEVGYEIVPASISDEIQLHFSYDRNGIITASQDTESRKIRIVPQSAGTVELTVSNALGNVSAKMSVTVEDYQKPEITNLAFDRSSLVMAMDSDGEYLNVSGTDQYGDSISVRGRIGFSVYEAGESKDIAGTLRFIKATKTTDGVYIEPNESGIAIVRAYLLDNDEIYTECRVEIGGAAVVEGLTALIPSSNYIQVQKGGSAEASISFIPSTFPEQGISWTVEPQGDSAATRYDYVDGETSSILIHGNNYGKDTYKAASQAVGEKSTEFTVEVVDDAYRIELDKSYISYDLAAKANPVITATVYRNGVKDSSAEVEWESSDTDSLVTYDASGNKATVILRSDATTGTGTITARLKSNAMISASCFIEVVNSTSMTKLRSITFENASVSMYEGDIYRLGYSVLPESQLDSVTLSFSYMPNGIVAAEQDPESHEIILTGERSGQSTITVTAKNGADDSTVTARIPVRVSESTGEPRYIDLDQTYLELSQEDMDKTFYVNARIMDSYGRQVTGTDTRIKWTVEDGGERYISYSSEGSVFQVTPLSAGEVKVTCSYTGLEPQTVTITIGTAEAVYGETKALIPSTDKLVMKPGDEMDVWVSLAPNGNAKEMNIRWSSDSEDVKVVSSSDSPAVAAVSILESAAPGTEAEIRIEGDGNLSETIIIKVAEDTADTVTAVMLDPQVVVLDLDSKDLTQFRARLYEDGEETDANGRIDVDTSKVDSYIDVTNTTMSGVIDIVKKAEGGGIITFSSSDDSTMKARAYVDVVRSSTLPKTLNSVVLSSSARSMLIGESYELKATVVPMSIMDEADGPEFTFTSGNDAVAMVEHEPGSDTATIIGTGIGTTDISVSVSFGGVRKTASMKVTVPADAPRLTYIGFDRDSVALDQLKAEEWTDVTATVMSSSGATSFDVDWMIPEGAENLIEYEIDGNTISMRPLSAGNLTIEARYGALTGKLNVSTGEEKSIYGEITALEPSVNGQVELLHNQSFQIWATPIGGSIIPDIDWTVDGTSVTVEKNSYNANYAIVRTSDTDGLSTVTATVKDPAAEKAVSASFTFNVSENGTGEVSAVTVKPSKLVLDLDSKSLPEFTATSYVDGVAEETHQFTWAIDAEENPVFADFSSVKGMGANDATGYLSVNMAEAEVSTGFIRTNTTAVPSAYARAIVEVVKSSEIQLGLQDILLNIPDTLTMTEGQTIDLRYTAVPSSITEETEFSVESSDPDRVSVYDDTIAALALTENGSVTLTITGVYKTEVLTKTIEVSVVEAPAAAGHIRIESGNTSDGIVYISNGGQAQATATLLDTNGEAMDNVSFVWAIEDTDVATITTSENGHKAEIIAKKNDSGTKFTVSSGNIAAEGYIIVGDPGDSLIGIIVNPSSLIIAANQEVKFDVTPVPTSVADKVEYTYQAENNLFRHESRDDGEYVIGVSEGKGTLTITGSDGQNTASTEIDITVSGVLTPSRIQIDRSSVKLTNDADTAEVKATVYSKDGRIFNIGSGTIGWLVDDESVATVTPDTDTRIATVKAKGAGQTVLKASYEGLMTSIPVTYSVPDASEAKSPTGLYAMTSQVILDNPATPVGPTDPELVTSAELEIGFTPNNLGAAYKTVRWTISGTSIAIDENAHGYTANGTTDDGKLTVNAVKEGTATVKATSTVDPSKYAEITVTVLPAGVRVEGGIPTLELDKTRLVLEADGMDSAEVTATLTDQDGAELHDGYEDLVWTLNPDNIVTMGDVSSSQKSFISRSGIVGKTYLKVAYPLQLTGDGADTVDPLSIEKSIAIEAVVTADIGKTLSSVILDRNEFVMIAGNTEQLTATPNPKVANVSLAWVSENENVATVSDTGFVEAKMAGTTNIVVTATQVNDDEVITVSASAKLTVLNGIPESSKYSSLTVNSSTLTLSKGGTSGYLTYTLTNEDGSVNTEDQITRIDVYGINGKLVDSYETSEFVSIDGSEIASVSNDYFTMETVGNRPRSFTFYPKKSGLLSIQAWVLDDPLDKNSGGVGITTLLSIEGDVEKVGIPSSYIHMAVGDTETIQISFNPSSAVTNEGNAVWDIVPEGSTSKDYLRVEDATTSSAIVRAMDLGEGKLVYSYKEGTETRTAEVSILVEDRAALSGGVRKIAFESSYETIEYPYPSTSHYSATVTFFDGTTTNEDITYRFVTYDEASDEWKPAPDAYTGIATLQAYTSTGFDLIPKAPGTVYVQALCQPAGETEPRYAVLQIDIKGAVTALIPSHTKLILYTGGSTEVSVTPDDENAPGASYVWRIIKEETLDPTTGAVTGTVAANTKSALEDILIMDTTDASTVVIGARDLVTDEGDSEFDKDLYKTYPRRVTMEITAPQYPDVSAQIVIDVLPLSVQNYYPKNLTIAVPTTSIDAPDSGSFTHDDQVVATATVTDRDGTPIDATVDWYFYPIGNLGDSEWWVQLRPDSNGELYKKVSWIDPDNHLANEFIDAYLDESAGEISFVPTRSGQYRLKAIVRENPYLQQSQNIYVGGEVKSISVVQDSNTVSQIELVKDTSTVLSVEFNPTNALAGDPIWILYGQKTSGQTDANLARNAYISLTQTGRSTTIFANEVTEGNPDVDPDDMIINCMYYDDPTIMQELRRKIDQDGVLTLAEFNEATAGAKDGQVHSWQVSVNVLPKDMTVITFSISDLPEAIDPSDVTSAIPFTVTATASGADPSMEFSNWDWLDVDIRGADSDLVYATTRMVNPDDDGAADATGTDSGQKKKVADWDSDSLKYPIADNGTINRNGNRYSFVLNPNGIPEEPVNFVVRLKPEYKSGVTTMTDEDGNEVQVKLFDKDTLSFSEARRLCYIGGKVTSIKAGTTTYNLNNSVQTSEGSNVDMIMGASAVLTIEYNPTQTHQKGVIWYAPDNPEYVNFQAMPGGNQCSVFGRQATIINNQVSSIRLRAVSTYDPWFEERAQAYEEAHRGDPQASTLYTAEAWKKRFFAMTNAEHVADSTDAWFRYPDEDDLTPGLYYDYQITVQSLADEIKFISLSQGQNGEPNADGYIETRPGYYTLSDNEKYPPVKSTNEIFCYDSTGMTGVQDIDNNGIVDYKGGVAAYLIQATLSPDYGYSLQFEIEDGLDIGYLDDYEIDPGSNQFRFVPNGARITNTDDIYINYGDVTISATVPELNISKTFVLHYQPSNVKLVRYIGEEADGSVPDHWNRGAKLNADGYLNLGDPEDSPDNSGYWDVYKGDKGIELAGFEAVYLYPGEEIPLSVVSDVNISDSVKPQYVANGVILNNDDPDAEPKKYATSFYVSAASNDSPIEGYLDFVYETKDDTDEHIELENAGANNRDPVQAADGRWIDSDGQSDWIRTAEAVIKAPDDAKQGIVWLNVSIAPVVEGERDPMNPTRPVEDYIDNSQRINESFPVFISEPVDQLTAVTISNSFKSTHTSNPLAYKTLYRTSLAQVRAPIINGKVAEDYPSHWFMGEYGSLVEGDENDGGRFSGVTYLSFDDDEPVLLAGIAGDSYSGNATMLSSTAVSYAKDDENDNPLIISSDYIPEGREVDSNNRLRTAPAFRYMDLFGEYGLAKFPHVTAINVIEDGTDNSVIGRYLLGSQGSSRIDYTSDDMVGARQLTYYRHSGMGDLGKSVSILVPPPNVTELRLSGNNLAECYFSWSRESEENLRILDLSDNRFKSLDVTGLHALEYLNLSNKVGQNMGGDLGSGKRYLNVTDCENLKVVNIDDTSFTDAYIEFSEAKNPKSFYDPAFGNILSARATHTSEASANTPLQTLTITGSLGIVDLQGQVALKSFIHTRNGHSVSDSEPDNTNQYAYAAGDEDTVWIQQLVMSLPDGENEFTVNDLNEDHKDRYAENKDGEYDYSFARLAYFDYDSDGQNGAIRNSYYPNNTVTRASIYEAAMLLTEEDSSRKQSTRYYITQVMDRNSNSKPRPSNLQLVRIGMLLTDPTFSDGSDDISSLSNVDIQYVNKFCDNIYFKGYGEDGNLPYSSFDVILDSPGPLKTLSIREIGDYRDDISVNVSPDDGVDANYEARNFRARVSLANADNLTDISVGYLFGDLNLENNPYEAQSLSRISVNSDPGWNFLSTGGLDLTGTNMKSLSNLTGGDVRNLVLDNAYGISEFRIEKGDNSKFANLRTLSADGSTIQKLYISGTASLEELSMSDLPEYYGLDSRYTLEGTSGGGDDGYAFVIDPVDNNATKTGGLKKIDLSNSRIYGKRWKIGDFTFVASQPEDKIDGFTDTNIKGMGMTQQTYLSYKLIPYRSYEEVSDNSDEGSHMEWVTLYDVDAEINTDVSNTNVDWHNWGLDNLEELILYGNQLSFRAFIGSYNMTIAEAISNGVISEDMIEIDFSLLAEQKYRDEFLRVYKTYDFMSQGDNDMEQISFSVRMGSKLWEGDGEDDGFLGSVGFDNFIVHKKWKGNGFLGIQWFSYEGWLKLTGAEGLGSGEITLSKVSGHKGTGTSVIGYNSSKQLEKYTEYEPEDMDVSILGGNGMVYLGDIRNKKLSFKLYDQSTVFAGHNGCAVVFPFGW